MMSGQMSCTSSSSVRAVARNQCVATLRVSQVCLQLLVGRSLTLVTVGDGSCSHPVASDHGFCIAEKHCSLSTQTPIDYLRVTVGSLE